MQKTALKNTFDRRNSYFPESVENRRFLQNSQGGTKENFSKMADFFGKIWKANKMGNTSRLIA